MKETPPVVFVVDDEPSVCAALKRLIRSVGLDVQTFASAREFLSAERPDAPGCLVLDVRLPGCEWAGPPTKTYCGQDRPPYHLHHRSR